MTGRLDRTAGPDGNLKNALAEMTRHYERYAKALTHWLTRPEAKKEIDAWLDHLQEMEESFMAEAFRAGDALEKLRADASRAEGRDLTLAELAHAQGAEEDFARAAGAVGEVARIRVDAIRALENFRDETGGEMKKISAARKMNKRYTSSRGKGRKVDGKI